MIYRKKQKEVSLQFSGTITISYMFLIYGECNKNASAVARLSRKETFSQKLFVFTRFHLTKRMTFMSRITKLHS
jgi:hypothetical protein